MFTRARLICAGLLAAATTAVIVGALYGRDGDRSMSFGCGRRRHYRPRLR
jgi:hypothetical protein